MRVRVERVIDGDSLLVARDRGLAGMLFGGGTVEVRLFGIDAPELGQSFGFEARSALEGMSRGPLTLKARSKDRYGRTVGTLMDSRGRSVNLMMVEAGFAHAFTRLGTIRGVREAERRARAGWSGPFCLRCSRWRLWLCSRSPGLSRARPLFLICGIFWRRRIRLKACSVSPPPQGCRRVFLAPGPNRR